MYFKYITQLHNQTPLQLILKHSLRFSPRSPLQGQLQNLHLSRQCSYQVTDSNFQQPTGYLRLSKVMSISHVYKALASLSWKHILFLCCYHLPTRYVRTLWGFWLLPISQNKWVKLTPLLLVACSDLPSLLISHDLYLNKEPVLAGLTNPNSTT